GVAAGDEPSPCERAAYKEPPKRLSSKPDHFRQVIAGPAISAAPSDRRQGFLVAESPEYYRYWVSAPGSPGRSRMAGKARHPIWPACRPAAHGFGRWWSRPALARPAAEPGVSGRNPLNRRHWPAARSRPAAWMQAEP